jgi:TonB family protein
MRLNALVFFCAFACPAFAANLDKDLSDLFVQHSFTIRNFYRGNHLRYGSNGQLLEKAEAGFWSRDGMVEISSVKISKDNLLVMEGKRTCVQFDPAEGEFSNVRTGDKVEIDVQLQPDQLTMQSVIPVLHNVFLSSHDRLADLVPAYWANCLRKRVDRADKHSPWECVADKQSVPDFAGKKIDWEVSPPDRTLHNGTKKYILTHRIGYLEEEDVTMPRLQIGPDPILQWEQRRTQLDAITLVLSFTVGEDGKPSDILIVTPVGMGIDDELAKALEQWQFAPGKRQGHPTPVHARVIFDISAPN